MIGDEDAAEVTAELAKPEDATAYIEERREQEEAESPPADESDKLIRDLREKL